MLRFNCYYFFIKLDIDNSTYFVYKSFKQAAVTIIITSRLIFCFIAIRFFTLKLFFSDFYKI